MRRSIIGFLLVCWLCLLSACGGTGNPAPDTGAGPGQEAIQREAECAFPQQMQVGRPATVRFSVFSAGNRPNALPAATATTEPLVIPERPDLQAWITVSLSVNGQLASQDAEQQVQQLSERSNIWVWQVTPTTAGPLLLQPIVDVEYRNAEGQVVERQNNVWTQTYTVEEVIGPSYASVMTSWLGDSVSEVISGMIGSLLMAGVVNPTRNFFARRFGKKSL